MKQVASRDKQFLSVCIFLTFSVSLQPYKIKSAYKALAAIPTNTLLQEQQVSVYHGELVQHTVHLSDCELRDRPSHMLLSYRN